MDFYDWLMLNYYGTNGLIGKVAEIAHNSGAFPRDADYQTTRSFFSAKGFSDAGLKVFENCWKMFTAYEEIRRLETTI